MDDDIHTNPHANGYIYTDSHIDGHIHTDSHANGHTHTNPVAIWLLARSQRHADFLPGSM
jgi:hypothetical protein